MTEEIIIDGVNVAGCYDFKAPKFCNEYLDGECEGHHCYWKEIKRLKQENKELQKQNDEECLRVTNLAMENTKLEKENKELKEKAPMKLIAKNNRYRFALEEIRNYCDRIEQGSVIGTQDCLINSIKNITNWGLNDSES